MNVDIQSEDGLSRKVWTFNSNDSGVRIYLNLTGFMEQSRQSRRHKFKTDAAWFAYSHDMRGVLNKLPEPASIPTEVMREAMSQINIHFLIGIGYDASKVAHYSLLKGTAF